MRQIILLLLVLIPIQAHSVTYYADNLLVDGDEQPINCLAGDYSIANRDCSGSDGIAYNDPWVILDNSQGILATGDHVIIRAGNYPIDDSYDIRNVSDVTIEGYQNEMPHLSAPVRNTAGYTDADFPYNVFYFHASTSNMTLKNLEISGSSRYAVSFASEHPWGTNYSTGGTIDGCIIHHSGEDIVKVQPRADNFTLINSKLYNSCERWRIRPNAETEVGTGSQNCQAFDSVDVDDILIADNEFYNVGYRNAVICPKGGGKNIIIERNYIHNSFGSIMAGGNTGPEYMDWYDNPTGYQIRNVTIRNNVVINTDWSGIFLNGIENGYIYNNTFVNVGRIRPRTPSIVHNLLTAETEAYEGVGLRIKRCNNWKCDDPDCSTTTSANTDMMCVNVHLFNNIFYRDINLPVSTDEFMNLVAWIDDQSDFNPIGDGELKANYNIYFDAQSPTEMRFREETAVGGGVIETGLANWQGRPIHDVGYAEVNSVYADPVIDMITGRLMPYSPYLSSGMDYVDLTDDFCGNPRPAGQVTPGAFQEAGINESDKCRRLPTNRGGSF